MKALIAVIESKPLVGYVLAGQGGIAGLMVMLKWLTPVIGFFSAVLGLAAAVITVIIKVKELKEKSKK